MQRRTFISTLFSIPILNNLSHKQSTKFKKLDKIYFTPEQIDDIIIKNQSWNPDIFGIALEDSRPLPDGTHKILVKIQ